jgi:hypothetical protein
VTLTLLRDFIPQAVTTTVVNKSTCHSSFLFFILFSFKRNRQKTSSNSGTPSYPVPSNWSPIDLSEEFKIVELSEVSDHNEYSKVKAEFMTTMAGFKVKSVKRVQNPGLWEDYERYVVAVVFLLLFFLR